MNLDQEYIDPIFEELAQLGPKPNDKLNLEDALLHYIDNPVDWVEDLIGIQLYDWQKDVMNALVRDRFVTVRSGHGVGKSCFSSCTALWFLCTHPFCKVICTAPTKEQLYDVLWAEASKWIRHSKKLNQLVDWQRDRIVVKTNPEEWFAIARTAEVKKLGKTGLAMAEGLQGRHAESILYILDEASGIDEVIMQTIDGALTSDDSYVLMIGNPTRTSGTFYDSFHTKRHLWTPFHVNSEDSKQVSKRWVQRMLEKYGSRDHMLYKIKVRGEFPDASDNAVFGLSAIEDAQNSQLTHTVYDPVEIGVDVARYGSNKTVFAVKRGPSIIKIDSYTQLSTMETAGRCVQYIREYKPYAMKIDANGVGAGVYDRLQEMKFKEVIPVYNGNSPEDDVLFVNVRAETYWNLRNLLEQRQLKLPGVKTQAGEQLVEEMTGITYKVNSKGKILIESKEDMMARGIKSPDALDAVVLACMQAQRRKQKTRFSNVSFFGR